MSPRAGGLWVGLALLATSAHPALAAPPDRYAVRAWTTADGLPQSSATGLTQSRDGYLWVTTFGGIARFDGARFVVYDQAGHPELPSNRFVAVAEDPTGTLWFSTEDHSLVRFDGERFSVVAPASGGHGANPASIVVDAAGVVWAVVDDELVRVEGGVARRVPEARATVGRAFTLQTDVAGSVWLASPDGAVCWSGPCGPGRGLEAPSVERLLEPLLGTSRGGAWFAEWPEVPVCAGVEADGPDFRWLRVVRWAGLDWCGDRSGLQSGAAHIRLSGGPEGHPSPLLDVRTQLVDREGTLWLGTIGGGLIQVRDRGVDRYGVGQGLPPSGGIAVAEDRRGRVWVASEYGLSWIQGGEVVPPDPRLDGLGHVWALAADPDGALWIAAEAGLHRYDDTLTRVPVPPALPRQLDALLVEPDGVVWAGGRGLWELRDGQVHQSWTVEELGGRVSTLERIGATVWVGTSGGVARVEGDTVHRLGAAEGLPQAQARDVIAGPGGAVWVGTYGGGLVRIDPSGAVRRLGAAEGLCDSVASRILVGTDGAWWINGNRGVSRVTLAELEAVASGASPQVRCDRFDTGEGNGNGGIAASDGSLWFTTVDGVVRMAPERLTVGPSPATRAESLTANGEPFEPGARVTVGRGDVAVRYTATGLADATSMTFQRRLVGRDRDWVPVGDDRVASFTNLRAGDYRLEVRARGPRGDWGAPLQIPFTLTPAWYRTPAFAGAAILTLGLTVGGVVRSRTRAARRHTRALEAEINERRRVEAELRDREAHYRTLFQRSTDGLFVHEASGALVETNPAATAMIGPLDPAAPPLAHVAPDSRAEVLALITSAAAGDTSTAVDAVLTGPGGEVEVVLQATALDHHGARRALLSARDVTSARREARERRRLEEDLAQAQKLEALGQLAGGIAHDFNNLLTVVRVHATLLRDGAADADTREDAEAILQSVDRAQAMTSKLLVFARRQPASVQHIDLRVRVDETLGVLRRTIPEDIAVVVRHHDFPLRVHMDPVRLEQIVMNLVLNARDALPEGGTIRVLTDLRLVPSGEAHRHGVTEGFYAGLGIEDDGVGIDPEVLARIFDPFFTTKHLTGTGLGLSTVHGAVHEARGFVTVQSRPGEGSRFWVHLPLSVSPGPSARVPTPVRAGPAVGARVLACDDEPAVLAVIARVLRGAGYDVVTAATPSEAIAAAPGAQLLVTDVVMPEMNGPALAAAVHRVVGPVPVLYVSGHTRDLLEERGLPAGSDLLWKPFSPEDLLARVAALLGS